MRGLSEAANVGLIVGDAQNALENYLKKGQVGAGLLFGYLAGDIFQGFPLHKKGADLKRKSPQWVKMLRTLPLKVRNT